MSILSTWSFAITDAFDAISQALHGANDLVGGLWVLNHFTVSAALRYIFICYVLTLCSFARDLTQLQVNATELRTLSLRTGPVIYNSTPWDIIFVWLFVFRYLRLVVHTFFFLSHKSVPVTRSPALVTLDATIIIPSVEAYGADFEECVRSVLANRPAQIIVVTIGPERLETATRICKELDPLIIKVMAVERANKRRQALHALPLCNTKIAVLIDDHVFWPKQFLQYLLAPFQDARVGGVGTKKRVRRFDHGFGSADFWNFMGCVYLERHNFDIAATTSIDGGVFCLSGRTSAIRTSILKEEEFIEGFGNEMIFNRWGPLNVDDDNFITRYLVRNGWDIKFQMQEQATMETTVGVYPTFLLQCLRWARSTWRSNSASLFTDRTVWYRQPWSVYGIYLTSFVNFALFYDATLIFSLRRTSFAEKNDLSTLFLVFWIFMSKTIKLIPHFARCPRDVVYFPGYIAFAYFHSFLKLYAGLTFYVTTWGSRPPDIA